MTDLVALQQELYVVDGGLHEVVDHGVVDVARVGELSVANVNGEPNMVQRQNEKSAYAAHAAVWRVVAHRLGN